MGEALPIAGKGDYTILVVDDEPDMRRYLVSVLAEEYRVLQADTGEKGLDLVRSHAPDLILLDWMLPGMDGLEICHILRNDIQSRDIKIILLTARVDEASKIKALKQGADDFLTKPFSTIEVQTRIANQLRTATLQNDLRKQNVDLENAFNKLKETESQLVQSEKLRGLGTLSAGLLHEVNNPLNYTLTAVNYALHLPGVLDYKEIKEALEAIEEGMGRIRDIVVDLRTFAHPEGEGQRQDVDLNAALDSALTLVAHETKGMSIVKEVDDGCTTWCSKT
ncbi:MAG: response regulator, partial [Deltaproteobacteria bacterium]|nr:response regulator [Deltaproteobacteria bacterium]